MVVSKKILLANTKKTVAILPLEAKFSAKIALALIQTQTLTQTLTLILTQIPTQTLTHILTQAEEKYHFKKENLRENHTLLLFMHSNYIFRFTLFPVYVI